MGRIDTAAQQMSDEEESKIDLTPMLDVVFIMLIFFIVTATFVKEMALDVNAPPETQLTSQPSESIAIRIRNTNVIEIDGLKVDKRAVAAQVIRRRAENPQAQVAVLAEPKSNADTLVTVVDALREAGIDGSIPITKIEP